MTTHAIRQLPAAAAAPLPRSLHILHADDMHELRELVRTCFGRDGHKIEWAEDGQIALSRVTADPTFDLVVTDHQMPKLNGLGLVTRLRAMSYPAKIMVFSSELSAADAAAYRGLNVDRILYKPTCPSVLRQILGELFP